MNTVNSYCQRITKDVVCTVILEDETEFIMCGEIVNGDIEESSVGPTFYQSKDFKNLPDTLQAEIIKSAFNEFKRFR